MGLPLKYGVCDLICEGSKIIITGCKENGSNSEK